MRTVVCRMEQQPIVIATNATEETKTRSIVYV